MAVLNNREKCGECLFFANSDHIGTCKRYPQYVVKSKNEWCGEFRLSELEIKFEQTNIEIQFKSPIPDYLELADEPKQNRRGRPAKK